MTALTWKDRKPTPIKINLAALIVDDSVLPVAIISRSSEQAELNLTEEKRKVIEDAKLRLAEQASITFRSELFAWITAFQVVYGTSRLGKILSAITSIGLFTFLMYGCLLAFQVISPPNFTTPQITSPNVPSTNDDN